MAPSTKQRKTLRRCHMRRCSGRLGNRDLDRVRALATFRPQPELEIRADSQHGENPGDVLIGRSSGAGLGRGGHGPGAVSGARGRRRRLWGGTTRAAGWERCHFGVPLGVYDDTLACCFCGSLTNEEAASETLKASAVCATHERLRMFGRSSGLPVPSSNFLQNLLRLPSETLLSDTSNMSSPECGPGAADSCYDKVAATHLRIAAIAVIFVTSALGVSIPLIGRRSSFLRTDGKPFFVAKAFAAGVILATAFVHMLPTAQDTLSNPCLPEEPWGKFAWAGFIAMLAALVTLVMDFGATEFYMSRHGHKHHGVDKVGDLAEKNDDVENRNAGHVLAHPHVHEHVSDDSTFSNVRHIVVAQVFEFGIVAHSIIIGITVGVSSSPCVIKPLFAALTFHQFFEGFALGGCIAQAGFRSLTALIMGFFFAVTTPLGIGIGMGISTTYNENSPKALIVQGVFDSISGGILVYMALVDLIAADFLSNRMRSSRQLQIWAFLALFSGSGAMALLGVWA